MREFLLCQLLTQPQVFYCESESYSDMFMSVPHDVKLFEKLFDCPQTMSDIEKFRRSVLYGGRECNERSLHFPGYRMRKTGDNRFHRAPSSSTNSVE
jgi:hypothetical protein